VTRVGAQSRHAGAADDGDLALDRRATRDEAERSVAARVAASVAARVAATGRRACAPSSKPGAARAARDHVAAVVRTDAALASSTIALAGAARRRVASGKPCVRAHHPATGRAHRLLPSTGMSHFGGCPRWTPPSRDRDAALVGGGAVRGGSWSRHWRGRRRGAGLHRRRDRAACPRRQRMVGAGGRPAGVGDDERFVLDFHVTTPACRPGDDAQLALAGRLFSQRLDRDHPLWEAWIVEGLRDRRFALITKVHHAMIDGVAGADLLAQLLRFTPDASVAAAPPWTPRPRPGGAELLRAEIGHHNRRVGAGLRWARDHLRTGVPAELRASGRGIVEALRAGLAPAPATRLNPPRIGPHRRFTTLGFDLAAIKQVKAALGGTINDVVLATVTGGLRRYLQRHGDDPEALGSLRALMPVNIRAATDAAGGNHVAMLLVPLPIELADPTRRLAAVSAASRRLRTESDRSPAWRCSSNRRRDRHRAGVERVPAGGAAARVQRHGHQRARPADAAVPAGRAARGHLPAGAAVRAPGGASPFSYAGSLDVGLVTCWHTVPDLDALAADVRAAFAELQATARAAPAITAAGPAAPR
jgi:hypothetical protein